MILTCGRIGIPRHAVAWFGGPHEHLRQQPHGVRLAHRKAAQGVRDPAPGGHEHRRAPDLRRADHDARDPAVHLPENAGACFLGFAIGESLGASALRIAGGIFTKIADIGSDLMKIVVQDQGGRPAQPRRDRDCTGDNAGDSVGPTADGFETYGVTGVALISFIALAVLPEHKAAFLVWIFVMRILMILTSIVS
jgi:hypothetical protein